MPHRWFDSECPQHSGATDPEHGFLGEARLPASHIEDVGDWTIGGIVLGKAGVEQDQGHSSDVDPPRSDRDITAVEGERDAKWASAVGIEDFAEGAPAHFEALVGVLLPAVRVNGLAEEPAPIQESDGDQGDAEIRRGLHVIAREHAEPARVEGELLVDAVLSAEVGNRAVEFATMVSVEPGLITGEISVESFNDVAVEPAEATARGEGLPGRRIHYLELTDRISCGSPGMRIDLTPQVACSRIP